METSLRFVVLVSTCFFFTQIYHTEGLDFSVDTENEPSFNMWKIKGFEYLKMGSELRQHKYSKFLPETLDLGKFDSTKGVWALFPVPSRDCSPSTTFWDKDSMESTEIDDSSKHTKWLGSALANFFGGDEDSSDNSTASKNHSSKSPTSTSTTTPLPTNVSTSTSPEPTTTKSVLCYKNANASIHFVFRAQLANSVTLRYAFGGNAKITFTGLEGGDSYELDADDNKKQLSNWLEEVVPLGQSWVHIHAVVSDKEDYVLIDKVMVDMNDSSRTSTTASSTSDVPTNGTTPPPQPAPASGQSKVVPTNASFVLLNALIYGIFKLF